MNYDKTTNKKRAKAGYFKFALILSIVVALMFSALTLFGCNKAEADAKVSFNRKTFSVADELKVGVISDLQLRNGGAFGEKFTSHFESALKLLKEAGANMIIIAGDIAESADDSEYKTFLSVIDGVFGTNKPIFQLVMGNHDFWGNGKSYPYCAENFEKLTGDSPWTHYVVNGFHFIGASPANGKMKNAYESVYIKLKEELEAAAAAVPGRAIFVTTHHAPKDTVCGSDTLYDEYLDLALRDFPQAVLFSGHSHFSLLDERSIHQRAYTVVNTQATAYVELDSGKVGGTHPPGYSDVNMGLLLNVGEENIEIRRLNFSDNGREEKTDKRWIIPVNPTKSSFIYTDSRADSNAAPKISGSAEIAFIEGKPTLRFDAGSDDDFVYSYKLVFGGGDEFSYFSDFYMGLSNMKTRVEIPLNGLPYENGIKIYAVDSFGKVSPNFLTAEL